MSGSWNQIRRCTLQPLAASGSCQEWPRVTRCCLTKPAWCIMQRDNNIGTADESDHGQGGPGSGIIRVPISSSAGAQGAIGDNTMGASAGSERVEPFNNNIPLFLDRTFRMIESVSDDIISWSEAGDSFIIKQVREYETYCCCVGIAHFWTCCMHQVRASNPRTRRYSIPVCEMGPCLCERVQCSADAASSDVFSSSNQ